MGLSAGTFLGLSAMVLYYRFFHPAGPIRLCVGESVDFKSDVEAVSKPRQERKPTNENTSEPNTASEEASPDFVIEFEENDYAEDHCATPPPVPKRKIRHSRSFKNSCPKTKRFLQQYIFLVHTLIFFCNLFAYQSIS